MKDLQSAFTTVVQLFLTKGEKSSRQFHVYTIRNKPKGVNMKSYEMTNISSIRQFWWAWICRGKSDLEKSHPHK